MKKNPKKINISLLLLLILIFILSFTIGRYHLNIKTITKVILGKLKLINYQNKTAETIIINIRLPRILAAVLIGSGLAVSGAVYQALFHNPLVSPDILGVSQGAAFGAALGILLDLSYNNISITSFIFGALAVLITSILSKTFKGDRLLGLILSGIMISSIFSSLLSFVKLVADPTEKLPAITYYLMGSLSSIKLKDLAIVAPIIIICQIIIIGYSWHLNLFTLGTEEMTIGIKRKLLMTIYIITATAITATCISISGIIGWIGLVIPHFARLLIGEDYQKLIPSSILIGSSFLLIVDNISRIATTSEIPLGILTSLVGAPVFLYLMRK